MEQPTFTVARAGIKGTIFVHFGKKKIGVIFPYKGGFQYRPKGSTHLPQSGGDVFPTLEACKDSLRTHD